MKTIQLTKILNFKRTLAAAAFALAALAYATPGQAMPHFVTFDFSGPGACSASIYEVAAKFSACNLKAEAKAAKRGVEPNLAACDAKVARWAKKSEKACCSDSISDPEEHEACVDALDTAIVDTGISTCEAGPSDPPSDAEASTIFGWLFNKNYIMGSGCSGIDEMLDTANKGKLLCCAQTEGCRTNISVRQSGGVTCYDYTCSCVDGDPSGDYESCTEDLSGGVSLDPSVTSADPAGR